MSAEQPPSKGPGSRARHLILSGPIGIHGKGLPPSERRRIFDQLYFEGERRRPYLRRFAVLIVLSALIAALGLVNDSAAVVIGAMLIAPLMTPMLGTAAAIVEGWRGRLWGTFVIVVLGASMAVAVGFMVAFVVPHLQSGSPLPGEILARTRPNLIDLAIALAAGAAGAYIMIRTEASSALPGVGISVALVPPLAAAGILAGIGDTDRTLGALLLFITNLLAIVFAASITFLLADFGAYRSGRVKAQQLLAGVILIGLMAVIAVPLTFNAVKTYGESERNRVAADVVREWDPSLTVERLVVDTTVQPMRITIAASGEELAGAPGSLAGLLARRLDTPVELIVDFQRLYQGAPIPAGS